ncbi:MAG TPA: acyl-CoA dehydrogenase [Cupriavidus sp.]|nr:acyl-CoA dehydrogenase [Cupriavidus sp.]
MSDRIGGIVDRVRSFMETDVYPIEDGGRKEFYSILPVLEEKRQKVKDLGLWTPAVSKEWGGLGLSLWEFGQVSEVLGRSPYGLFIFNCNAPDAGNIEVLTTQGTEEQQERFLRPLLAGKIRSCFSMTEPEHAGSNPVVMSTTAVRDGDDYVINGHKWFISGAVDAAFAIVLARTDEAAGTGATMFIVDTDNPGYRLVRNIAGMDGYQVGGHGEIVFEQCVVDDDAVLGQVGQGFAYAQARLEPARLSHCMRFIGRASRAMEIAQQYAAQRESFGQRLADLQQVQAMVADSHIDLHASRLMVRDCARKMDAGESVKHDSAMTKIFVSEAVWRVADRAVQIMGALGISDDTPVSMIQRELRPFRIYDGASELHRATLARRIFQHGLRP